MFFLNSSTFIIRVWIILPDPKPVHKSPDSVPLSLEEPKVSMAEFTSVYYSFPDHWGEINIFFLFLSARLEKIYSKCDEWRYVT